MNSKKIKPKMIKIKTKKTIKTRTIEIGANGKEYVVKDWS
jgi:hypothetical protein